MEPQEAIAVLKNLLDKPSLSAEEKAAVTAAIGMLSWTVLAQSRVKSLKDKRAKSTDWQPQE